MGPQSEGERPSYVPRHFILFFNLEFTKNYKEGEKADFSFARYRGSDDDLRARFEEYILSALSSIKYSNYLSQTNPNPSLLSTSSPNAPSSSSVSTLSMVDRDPDQQDLMMAGLGGTKEGAEAIRDFGEGWVGVFRGTKVYEIWNESTDETLFDIHEPRYVFLIFSLPNADVERSAKFPFFPFRCI